MSDIALVNGRVYTVDPRRPWAEAVLVREGRIAALGSTKEVAAEAAAGVDIIDLAGRMLLPGFQDAHVHPCKAGVDLTRCDLHRASGLVGYQEVVLSYADANPGASWILGGGWSMDDFPGGVAKRRDLDAVVPDRPAFLVNRDGHGAWVNSAALELAGIGAGTSDPADGWIAREEDGSALGTLHEGAMRLVGQLVPKTTIAEIEAGILAAQDYLLSLGITAWQDAWVDEDDHIAYLRLAGAGRLRSRVVGCLWWERERGEEQIEGLIARRAQTPRGRYRASAVKIMQDGVCENFTAAMLTPYLDAAGTPSDNDGLSFIDPEELQRHVTRLDGEGFQVHFHAIGDRAVRECLDAVAAARAINGPSQGRHHVAHLQVVHPKDRPRFVELDVVANAQPLWANHDGYQDDLTIPFLGPERAKLQYPWRSLLDAGARLAFGSDWSVSSPNPLGILNGAVTRTHRSFPEPVFIPEERLDLPRAIEAYTAGSAFVNHLDDGTGTLEIGKLADLVVVDRDLFAEQHLYEAKVDLTLIAGEVVYERPRSQG